MHYKHVYYYFISVKFLIMSHSKFVGVLCADDSDSLSEGEEYLPESEVSKLPWGSIGPKLTQDEIRMKKTYSYDPEPVKAWREITDYMAIKNVTRVYGLRYQILLGKNMDIITVCSCIGTDILK